MKIFKSIEMFDCEQFKLNKIYFIDGWEEDNHYQGLFICAHSFSNTNAVELKRIMDFNKGAPSNLRIDNNNYKKIDIVSEVNCKYEYDPTINEWNVYASIRIEEGQCY